MLRRRLFGREEAGALHDHVHAEPLPGELRGVALCEHGNLALVHDEGALLGVHDLGEIPVDRVVDEQVGEGFRVSDVVDSDNLDVAVGLGCPQDEAADASETVDGDSHAAAMAVGSINAYRPASTGMMR